MAHIAPTGFRGAATDRKLARIAEVLGARPRGDGSWYAAHCPECGTRWALSLTSRGAECRWDGCRRSTRDLRTVVAKWMAMAGRSRTQIERALRGAA